MQYHNRREEGISTLISITACNIKRREKKTKEKNQYNCWFPPFPLPTPTSS